MRTVAFILSLILIFTIPWENAITVGGVGTLTKVIGLFAVLAWLGSALVTGTIRKPYSFHLLIYLFILWNILSFYWSVGSEETLMRIQTYGQLALLTCILWDLYETPNALQSALQAYIIGAYVAISSTIYNYLRGQEISTYSGGRYAGASLNAGDLALILILGMPVAWHLALNAENGAKDHIQRLVNIVYIPIAVFTVILTAARSAIFAIIPAAFYIVGTTNRLKPFFRILISVALVGGLFALQLYAPRSSIDRLATVGDSIAMRDLGGRVTLWNASLAIISEHPILGIGAGSLHSRAGLGTVAHNTYLSVLAELGPIGFILFAVMLTAVVYQACRPPRRHYGLWLTVLAIWAIGALTLSWEFRKPTWLLLSLVVISANLSIDGDRFAFRSAYSVENMARRS